MTETSSTGPLRSRSIRRPLASACGALADEPTACDGLVYKESGLARKEYLPCAGEMMATLDQLDSQIEKMLDAERKGVAVVVDLDEVSGRGLHMTRD